MWRNGFFQATLCLCIASFFLVYPGISPARPFAFRDVTTELQFDYFGSVGEVRPQLATMFVDNEGVYAADVDNDYRSELLVLGGPSPRLYEFRDGTMQEIKTFPDLDGRKINGAVFTDYNVDGYRDLVLIPQTGPVQLLENRGGSFERAGTVGSVSMQAGIGATAGDYNGDGCPDVFVIQYGKGSSATPKKQKRYRYGAKYRNLKSDNGQRNLLLTGNCHGLVHDPRTLFDRRHWSLAASFFDANADGLSDIHVANDFYRDSLYVAQPDGSFDHHYLGLATSRNGMSSTVTDFNQDGLPDLFVSNIFLANPSKIFDRQRFITRISSDPNGHNALINQGDLQFEDRAKSYGIKRGGWGWAAIWGDLTNDFTMDLIQALQNHLAVPPSARQMNLRDPNVKQFLNQFYNHRPIPKSVRDNHPHYEEFQYWVGYPNLWMPGANDRDKFVRKEQIARTMGRMNARGMTTLDYDLDGDLDLAVGQFLNRYKLFENNTNTPYFDRTGWVKIHFQYPEFGGQIVLELDGRKLRRPITSRTDFSSQQPATYNVGLKKRNSLDQLRIQNHNGKTYELMDLRSGSLVVVRKDQIQRFAPGEWKSQ